ALASTLGLSARVRFAGYISPAMTTDYYAIAEVVVLPSVTTPEGKEPWGLVINEAMNQAVPVIASDAVGAAAGGLVQDGVNGFVVPERNPSVLADRIRKVLDDPALHKRLSAGARGTIASWDNEAMVAGFRAAIEF